MPWSTNASSLFSGLWQSLQTAGRRGRSVCRTEACGNVPSDNAQKQLPPAPKLPGRKEHLAHSQPAHPTERARISPRRERRASRGRSRSPDVESGCTSRDDQAVTPQAPIAIETSEQSVVSETRKSLFQRFCCGQFRRHISIIPGGGLEEVQTQSGVFMLAARRELCLTELFPKCFSPLADITKIGPGTLVIEVEQCIRMTRQALHRFACCRNGDANLPVTAVLLTSFDKERGADIVAARQIYTELLSEFNSLAPGVTLILACTSFDETACAEREASLQGRALSSDTQEGRGRTLSRGSRSRRDHAPPRRMLSREPFNERRAPTGGELADVDMVSI